MKEVGGESSWSRKEEVSETRVLSDREARPVLECLVSFEYGDVSGSCSLGGEWSTLKNGGATLFHKIFGNIRLKG
jgi:hypothetical protein